jgi:hypothetical protein
MLYVNVTTHTNLNGTKKVQRNKEQILLGNCIWFGRGIFLKKKKKKNSQQLYNLEGIIGF